MRTKQFSRMVITAAFVLGGSLAAAQETPQTTAAQKQVAQPAAAKSPIVWTNDDVKTLRSPADIYTKEKEAQAAAAAAAAKQAAAAAKQAAAKPAPRGAPPALSNPKTPEDADKMIAWENRDIAAEQQFVDELKQEAEQAPPDQKDRLQRLLQQHIEELANTRKEMEGLVVKKKDLEKKPAAGNNTAATTPPSQ